MNKFLGRHFIMFNADTGGGNGGTPGGTTNNNDQGVTLSQQEVAALRSMISTQGGEQNTLHTLFAENARLKSQLADSQANQIPAGSLILVGQDVETWKQLRGLDIPIGDLKEKLGSINQLEGQVRTMKREGHLRSVAGITGWNPEVLIALDGLDTTERTFEIQDADGGGKMVFIKEGETGQPVDAATYLQNKWPHFIPSLTSNQGADTTTEEQQVEFQSGGTVIVPAQNQAGDGQNQNGQQPPNNQTQQVRGTVYLTQPAGGSSTGTTDGGDENDEIRNAAKGALATMYGQNKDDKKQEAA